MSEIDDDELSKTCDEVLDGTSVDWDTKILQRPELKTTLDKLRIVESVANQYREATRPPSTREIGAETSLVTHPVRPSEEIPFERWGHLRLIAASPSSGILDLTATAHLLRKAGEGVEPIPSGSRISARDSLLLEFWSPDRAFVYILNQDEMGEHWVLFPIPGLELRNPLPANQKLRLPSLKDGSRTFWKVSSPGGTETVLVVASRERLAKLESAIANVPRAGSRERLQGTRQLDEVLRRLGGLEKEQVRAVRPLELTQLYEGLYRRRQARHDIWMCQIQVMNP